MRLSPTHQKSDPDLLFKKEDAPDLKFWQEWAPIHGPNDLTGEELHRATTAFCSVAKRGSSTWKPRLEMDYGIDNYTLHWASIALIQGPPGKPMEVGINMLSTAASLSYQPSLLSLKRLSLKWDAQRITNPLYHKMFTSAEAQFKQLAQTVRDPDILTLQGLQAQKEGKAMAAQKLFNEAITLGQQNAGNPPHKDMDYMRDAVMKLASDDSKGGNGLLREPRWNYEADCRQQLGRILVKMGHKNEAEYQFLVNAVELDLPQAFLEIAKLNIFNDRDAKELLLLKVAQMGNREACQLLVREYLMRLEEAEATSSTEPKSKAPETRLLWWWMKLAGRYGNAKPDTELLEENLMLVNHAVEHGRASFRLQGVNKDGTSQVAAWVYDSKGEVAQKVMLNI